MLKLQAFFAGLTLFTQGVLEKLQTQHVTKIGQFAEKSTFNFSQLSPEQLYDEVKKLSLEFNEKFHSPDFEDFKAKNKNKAQALYDAVQKLTSSEISDKRKTSISSKLAEAFGLSTLSPTGVTTLLTQPATPQGITNRAELPTEKDKDIVTSFISQFTKRDISVFKKLLENIGEVTELESQAEDYKATLRIASAAYSKLSENKQKELQKDYFTALDKITDMIKAIEDRIVILEKKGSIPQTASRTLKQLESPTLQVAQSLHPELKVSRPSKAPSMGPLSEQEIADELAAMSPTERAALLKEFSLEDEQAYATPQDFRDALEKLQKEDKGGKYLPLANQRHAEALAAELVKVMSQTKNAEHDSEFKKVRNLLIEKIKTARN